MLIRCLRAVGVPGRALNFVYVESILIMVFCISSECCIRPTDNRYVDEAQDNFLIDSEGRVCIIDFQHVGVLSEAFQQYAFFNIDKAFAAKVGRKLGYQPSEAVNEMVKVSSLLHQRGG